MRKTRPARILSSFGITQTEIAEVLGLSQPSIHRKIHGLQEWTGSEINAVLELVHRTHPEATYEQIFGERAA